MACVTRKWAGVDSAWEQRKPEVRKMLENRAREASNLLGANFVGRGLEDSTAYLSALLNSNERETPLEGHRVAISKSTITRMPYTATNVPRSSALSGWCLAR